jgi:hypothetical protein
MAAFHELGVELFLPFGENTRCDIVAGIGGELRRVQCKTGRLREGAIRFPVCSNYGHHRNPQTYHRDYRGQVDYFAVYCPETTGIYLIPIVDLPGVLPISASTRLATTSDGRSDSPRRTRSRA